MSSHRRPGVLARALRLHRSPPHVAVPAPRRAGIELVDARSRVAHRVSSDELLAGRQRGNYQALCGVRLLAASMVDPGRSKCRPCRERASPSAPPAGRAASSWWGCGR
ncbi:MAG: hypothetical protein ACRDRX_02300 [Pseudonocardiaceae bacterium]